MGSQERGLGAEPPRKFSVTTPFRLSENEGNALFRDNSLTKIATFPCQGYKNGIDESRTSFCIGAGGRSLGGDSPSSFEEFIQIGHIREKFS